MADVSPLAPWRGTDCSMDDISNNVFVSTLFSIPGFVLSSIKPDFMHICDLGILQYIQGCVLFDLWRELGGTWKNHQGATTKLLNMLKLQAAALGVEAPIHNLTIFMIRGSGKAKPKLKIKAAEGRHLLPILRQVLLHCMPCTTEHQLLRYRCVDALNSVYLELQQWRAVASTRRIGQFARRHVVLLKELHDSYGDDLM